MSTPTASWASAVLVIVLGVCSELTCATVAFGQSPFGSIRGSIYDEQKGALAGVMITVSAPDVPGVFSAMSDADGSYRLIDLPPGTYALIAQRPQFATFTRQPVILRAGLNVLVDVEMKVGGVSESVDVKVDPPLLEARQPLQAVNISGDYQRSVPTLARRNWADFMALAPGVTIGTNNIALFFYVHGVDFDEHVIQLDGADIASGQQNQLSYISLNPDALQDVQVRLAGVDASAQMGYGAVISAVTQSGTNLLKGSASMLAQPRRWNDANVPGGTSTTSSTYESDFSVGGPIVRDRLWYFGTYRHYAQEAGVSRTPEQIATLQALVPGFQPFDSAIDGNFYFAKATGNFANGQRLEGFFERDKSPQEFAGPTLGANISKRIQGGNAASARWMSVWTQRLTSTINWSFNDKNLPTVPFRTDVPQRNVYASTVLSGGRLTGASLLATLDNGSNWQDVPYRKVTLSGDATCDESARDLSRGAALALFRIVQEALGNAAKHASPKTIKVWLARSGDTVSLGVADDGVGFDVGRLSASGGLGLVMMRERASQLNGTFEFSSAPGHGTTIRVVIPFR